MAGVLVVILEVALLGLLSWMAVFSIFTLFALVSFAPYVHSGKKKMLKMLDMAQVQKGMRVLELGSGNGDLCRLATERGAAAVGIEINPLLVLWSRFKCRMHGTAPDCRFMCRNIWHTAFPADTDAVFLYGMPEKMSPLWDKMLRELKPGTIIVSHAFLFPGQTPEAQEGNVRRYRLAP